MSEGRSVWAWLGLGCAALAVLAIVVAVGGGFWLYRTAEQFRQELEDPAARTAKVLRVLGTDRLPEGYHAMVAFRLPFLMQVAILSGRAPGPDGQVHTLGERGLIYVQLFDTGQDRAALRDYFEGRTSDPGVLKEHHINIDVDEIINRGVVSVDAATLLYVAQRGGISMEGYRGEGITTVVLVECPEDSKTRMAIWFAPDPASAEPGDHADFSGTPADEVALIAFMDQFRLCGA